MLTPSTGCEAIIIVVQDHRLDYERRESCPSVLVHQRSGSKKNKTQSSMEEAKSFSFPIHAYIRPVLKLDRDSATLLALLLVQPLSFKFPLSLLTSCTPSPSQTNHTAEYQ